MNKVICSTIFSFFLTISAGQVFAQSAVDTLTEQDQSQNFASGELFNERIQKISASKRIFILTNENKGYGPGDFITLVTEGQRAARAIVAKLSDESGGVKIIKIYSLNLWNKLKAGKEVQILRGDDSLLLKPKTEEEEEIAQIESEEDLFNETLLEGDVTLDEDSKRAIKQDNIVGVAVGRVAGVDTTGASARYTQLNASWAYQLDDNIWGELSVGRNTISGFPSTDIDTTINNITVRAKYTIIAPFDSYLKPYIGYQILNVDSPDAGSEGTNVTQEQRDRELELVDQTEKSEIIFGATILKRLVPGWFVRADIGSDILNFGFSLEF